MHLHLYLLLAEAAWELVADIRDAFEADDMARLWPADGPPWIQRAAGTLAQLALALGELSGAPDELVRRIHDAADIVGMPIRPLAGLVLEAHQAMLGCDGRGTRKIEGGDHERRGH